MKMKIAFDINGELANVESIANKYIKDDPTFLFTRGERYPVIDKHKYSSSEVLSRESYMPYKCVPCVVVLLLKHIYGVTCDERDLFEINPLYENGENLIEKYSLAESEENVIEAFMPAITLRDKNKIIDEVKMIFARSNIFRHVANLKDHIFSISHEDRLFILNVEGHIKEMRYQELLDNSTEEGEYEWMNR